MTLESMVKDIGDLTWISMVISKIRLQSLQKKDDTVKAVIAIGSTTRTDVKADEGLSVEYAQIEGFEYPEKARECAKAYIGNNIC